MVFNRFIDSSQALVTTHEQTRAGFLSIALEKNRVGDPFVKNALAFKSMVAKTTGPDDFLTMDSIKPFLITASGLSDKSLRYLTDEDKIMVIKELIEKFLKPAGVNYIDETIYRYLLIKGDSVGGTMRNRIGELGQEKLVRAIISCMNVRGIEYNYLLKSGKWSKKPADDSGIEKNMKAIQWGDKVIAFNLTIPVVKKNVDICLFEGDITTYDKGNIVKHPELAMMFGELKGGIDPAGADEHWKTANTALGRIRESFSLSGYENIKTSFVGAAIANAMAEEIYEQLQSGKMSNAANLNDTNQIIEYCNWILDL